MFDLVVRILLSSVLIYMPIWRGAVRPWSVAPAIMIVYGLFFTHIYRRFNGSQHTGRNRSVIDTLITCFIAAAGISAFYAVNMNDSITAILRITMYAALFYMVREYYSMELRNTLIRLVIVMGTLLSLAGILQYFNVLPSYWWNPEKCIAATYVNHNHFAGYLELIIPVLYMIIAGYMNGSDDTDNSGIKKLYLPLLVISLCVMFAAFILAKSRGAWLCMAVTFIAVNIVLIKRKILDTRSFIFLIILIIGIVGIGYMMDTSLSGRIDSIVEIFEGKQDAQIRLNIWESTIHMIKARPVTGWGIGSFETVFPKYRPEYFHHTRVHFAHNEYLHILSELGPAGLILMVSMLGIVVVKGFKKYSLVTVGMAGGILSLVLHGMVDFNFHIPANMTVVVIWAAFVMGDEGAAGTKDDG